eukprot:TRINITY_DN518_c0_g2_i3.p1 TRINITY_DN518_c0_g2~~TRINITY_DN518_c0_g2_i3.p1  ORF type:complete len:130 (+),score=58.43 TRINITY_DN518_c0_g2_i3:66-455(+)
MVNRYLEKTVGDWTVRGTLHTGVHKGAVSYEYKAPSGPTKDKFVSVGPLGSLASKMPAKMDEAKFGIKKVLRARIKLKTVKLAAPVAKKEDKKEDKKGAMKAMKTAAMKKVKKAAKPMKAVVMKKAMKK